MRKGENNCYLENCELRKHILCTTVFTRKFLLLIMIAKLTYENEGRFGELCDKILALANQLLVTSAKDASHSTTISLEQLYRTIQFYNEIDEKLVAASIRRKIDLYFECLDKVLSEPPTTLLLFRPTGLYKINLGLLCKLTDEQICQELDDYADEINAWLDIEFVDEYDDYCVEDQGFDCYVELSAKIWILSKLIRERN